MRLCVIKNRDIGLTETFIRDQVNRLPADVSVIQGQPPRLEMPNDKSITVSTRTQLVQRLRNRLDRDALVWRQREAEYVDLLKSARADVVLAHYGPTGVLVVDACKRLGLPLVVHFHGYDASRTDVLNEFRDGYARLFRYAAAIVVVSQAMRRTLIALGAPDEKVVVNPCSVDIGEFKQGNPADAAPVFLAVGRLVEKKAPHLMLLAFAMVYRQNPLARLRIIGDGHLIGVVQDMIVALGLEESVVMLGPQSHDVVREEMQRARAFVQHSVVAVSGDSEGTPVGILEAGASGLPVVSTFHAGIPDVIVEGLTGFLVSERDVPATADRMIRLANDPGLAQSMGDAARRRISQLYGRDFRLSRLWRVLEEAYQGQGVSASLRQDAEASLTAQPLVQSI